MDTDHDDVVDAVKHLLADKNNRHAFGEAVTVGATTVLPVAQVGIGGGGGAGKRSRVEQSDDGSGWGGGYGLTARPVGAFVITDHQVTWMPVWDPSRLALIAGAVTLAVVFLSRWRRSSA